VGYSGSLQFVNGVLFNACITLGNQLSCLCAIVLVYTH